MMSSTEGWHDREHVAIKGHWNWLPLCAIQITSFAIAEQILVENANESERLTVIRRISNENSPVLQQKKLSIERRDKELDKNFGLLKAVEAKL